MSLRKAAETFQVPKDALHRRLKQKLKPRRELDSPSASNAQNKNMSISFMDIVNVPRVTVRRKTKRAEKSQIITSSPYKKKVKANEVRSCSS